MSNTSEGDQVVPASLPAAPPSVALSPVNEPVVAVETNESNPKPHFVIGSLFDVDGGEQVSTEPDYGDEKPFVGGDSFGVDHLERGLIAADRCTDALIQPAASEQSGTAGPGSDLPCDPQNQFYPGPDQIAVEVHDKSTFTTLSVYIGVEEGVSSAEQLLDPYDLMRRRAKDPESWPVVGIAGKDWNFTALASRGEPVCALTVAIESHHVDHILPLVDALGLEDAPESVRRRAGEIALRCMNSVGILDSKHVPCFWAALALIGAGAKVPGGLAALGAMTVNYVAEPDEHAWRRLAPHTKIETTVLDSTRTTSALAAIILAALPRDVTLKALTRLLQDDLAAAAEHREQVLDQAPLLHLAIVAGRLDCLQVIQESFQIDDRHWAQAQVSTDALGRTASDLADAMERRECAHNLRVNAAKHAASSVLLQELD